VLSWPERQLAREPPQHIAAALGASIRVMGFLADGRSASMPEYSLRLRYDRLTLFECARTVFLFLMD